MRWNETEERLLRERYATTPNAELVALLSRGTDAIKEKAKRMGLKKPVAFSHAIRAKSRVGLFKGREKEDPYGVNTGRCRAQRYYKIRSCEVCGVSPEEARIERHHINANTLDNRPENIRFLCVRHHMLEDGRLDATAARNRSRAAPCRSSSGSDGGSWLGSEAT